MCKMELSFKESNKNVFINNYNFAKFIELFQCRPNFDFLEIFIKSDFNFEVLTNLENYMKEEDKKELADLTGTEYNYDNLTEKVYFEDFSAKEKYPSSLVLKVETKEEFGYFFVSSSINS